MIDDPATEAENLLYMRALREAELEGARQEVLFGPFTAMVVIGALQLATRHPRLPDEQRAHIRAVIDRFRPWFAGTPGEQLIDRGNDPEEDR